MQVPGLNSQATRYSAPAFQSLRRFLHANKRSDQHTHAQAIPSTLGHLENWFKLSAKFFVKLVNYYLFCFGLFMTTLRCCKRSSVLFIYYRHNLNGFIPALVSKVLGIPSVVEVNTPISLSTYYSKNTNEDRRASGFAWREKLQYDFSEVISVVSPFIQKWIIEHCKKNISKKIIFNPNGVNPERFSSKKKASYVRNRYNISSDEILIGMASRFREL